MPRPSRNVVSALLFTAALAGCSDGPVSPATKQIEAPFFAAPAPISSAPAGRPALDLVGGFPDSVSVDFSVGPNGGIFFAGNHAVVIPAQSVCDPATSSYGPSTWDQPCPLLQSPLRIHAEVRRKDGKTWVDFSPSLRFAPSSNPGSWAWIVMYAPTAIGTTGDLSGFNILWAKSIGGAVVDETPDDATLRTYIDTFSGVSLRRIKHFSGYVIGSGKSCDATSEGC
ncbi:MAG: hypothetical protein DMD35_04855 [Gemmatimonadetes bacterium]|nr:MAG: hypothetical protein DMD35_04855 [Gemmatimonadota bacterium]